MDVKPKKSEIKKAKAVLKRLLTDDTLADQFTEEEIEELEWIASFEDGK